MEFWSSVRGRGEEECFTAVAEMPEAHPSGILGLQFCSKTMCLGWDEGKKHAVPLKSQAGQDDQTTWYEVWITLIYQVPEMKKHAGIGYEMLWDMELKDMNDGMMMGYDMW